MAELSKEELALLAAAEEPGKATRRRKSFDPAERGAVAPKVEHRDEPKVEQEVSADADTTTPATPQAARGPLTPVQYGGDGWGDTPIQMRG